MKLKAMSEMIGIEEDHLRMFLDLMAVHMGKGATFEQAMEKTRSMLERMSEQAALHPSQQDEWFVAWRTALAVEVWHSVRRSDELHRIFRSFRN